MPTTATTFRLTPEDNAILDDAVRVFGLSNRTEALRFLIRLWDGSASVLGASRKASAKARTKARHK